MNSYWKPIIDGIIKGVGWAIALALIGLLAKGAWYAITFGWDLI